MSINYDLFPGPPRDENDEKPDLYARAVMEKAQKTEKLIRMIHAQTTFSPADISGLLDALAEHIYWGLSNSRNVYLKGIGTFSLSLKSPAVKDKKDIRAEHISVKAIHFRADPVLKKRIRGTSIERVSSPRHQNSVTPELRQKRIFRHVVEKGSIHQTKVREINRCSAELAKQDIEALIQSGKLKSIDCGKRTIYICPEIPNGEK